jgi:hypothetical protein
MRSFSPKLLRVCGAAAETLEPVAFQGRIDELTLERHIAAQPALVGEPLLVLGRQLAEFEEDKDRLDVLAIDKDGEIVLIELKVTDDFRVTDLQALAYAGAYATRETEDLARTLRRHLERVPTPTSAPTEATSAPAAPNAPGATGPSTTDASGPQVSVDGDGGASPAVAAVASPATAASVSLDQAKARIVEFLELDDFEGWRPSQQVRIKLVAPSFPRRVLKNVKYLGDVYGMPVEAIAARLFETPDGQRVVAFERLLPLPGEDEFDLTLRRREELKREDNVRRRQNVVPLLVKAGKLVDGQTLYLHRSVLPAPQRDLFDPTKVAFQVTVRSNGSNAKFAWRPEAEAPEKELPPSAIAYELYKAVLTDWAGQAFSTAVAATFTVEPDGKTLADVALDHGLWSPAEAAS